MKLKSIRNKPYAFSRIAQKLEKNTDENCIRQTDSTDFASLIEARLPHPVYAYAFRIAF